MTLHLIGDDDSVLSSIKRDALGVLVSCGDIADRVILQAAQMLGSSEILTVKGNHDSGGAFPPPIVDLHLMTHTVAGVRFGGFHGSWRYKPAGHYLYEQSQVEHLLASFPPVDVFIAHNSPRHIHDREDDVHFGFEAFRRYIDQCQPRLFIHGHQHVNHETQLGSTRVIGIFGYRCLEIQ